VGIIVNKTGTGWINALMPPVVMGAIVALIGFNLAPVVKDNWNATEYSGWVALITITAVLLITVVFRGLIGRLSIVHGMVVGYIAAIPMGEVDFSAVGEAAWVGLPDFH